MHPIVSPTSRPAPSVVTPAAEPPIHVEPDRESPLVRVDRAPTWRAEFAWSDVRGGPGLTTRYFRRAFAIAEPGGEWRIHVSADARYRLWLNGHRVGFGPAKGSLARYYFDTYDLGPLLRPGRNVLAAEVRWFGENSPLSEVHSPIPGWLVQDEREGGLDTPGEWRVWNSDAVTPDTTSYIDNAQQFLNHLEILDTRQEPAGWRELDFDDSAWAMATSTGPAAATGATWGVAPLRTLVPRDVSAMHEATRRFTRVIRHRRVDPSLPGAAGQAWTLEAGRGGKLLLDVGDYTTGFPQLAFAGGAGREVRVLYAEALGEWTETPAGRRWEKSGVRDDFTRLEPHGYRDTVYLRGGEYRWEPFYWRAFRWIEIEILPGPEPVALQDIAYRECVHPQAFTANFASSDPESERIFQVSLRTFRVGAHEIYDDSPYYEQFSYIADARLECLGSLHLCNAPELPRRTLQLYLDTLRADGLLDARVPCQYARQTIPYFCLHWIFMVEDYWRWVGRADQDFVRQCLVAVDTILLFFRARLREDGLVGRTGGWNMVDDVEAWHHGQPPAVLTGGSTYLSCLYVEALLCGARLHREAGLAADGERWQKLAERLGPEIRRRTWDEAAGLFVEGVEHREPPFSQHSQAAAINAGVATPAQAQRILERLCRDDGLIRASSMQSYYLSRALEQAGGYGQWHTFVLSHWRQALTYGISTWPEYPDPTRSDSHAWAAWPGVDYVRTVLGIRPGAPGWAAAELRPQFSGLDWARGRGPTPHGFIEVDWVREGDSVRLKAQVPAGLPTELVYPGGRRETFPAGGLIERVVAVTGT